MLLVVAGAPGDSVTARGVFISGQWEVGSLWKTVAPRPRGISSRSELVLSQGPVSLTALNGRLHPWPQPHRGHNMRSPTARGFRHLLDANAHGIITCRPGSVRLTTGD